MVEKVNMKGTELKGDAFGRLITKSLKDEAEQVCTPDIRDKIWVNISRRIKPLSENDISIQTKTD